jgi:hypothetical protein
MPNYIQKFVDDKPTWRTKFLKYIYLSTTLYTYSAHKTHSKNGMTSAEVVLVQLDLSWWWAHSARSM